MELLVVDPGVNASPEKTEAKKAETLAATCSGAEAAGAAVSGDASDEALTSPADWMRPRERREGGMARSWRGSEEGPPVPGMRSSIGLRLSGERTLAPGGGVGPDASPSVVEAAAAAAAAAAEALLPLPPLLPPPPLLLPPSNASSAVLGLGRPLLEASAIIAMPSASSSSSSSSPSSSSSSPSSSLFRLLSSLGDEGGFMAVSGRSAACSLPVLPTGRYSLGKLLVVSCGDSPRREPGVGLFCFETVRSKLELLANASDLLPGLKCELGALLAAVRSKPDASDSPTSTAKAASEADIGPQRRREREACTGKAFARRASHAHRRLCHLALYHASQDFWRYTAGCGDGTRGNAQVA